jgi:hypothetical protein
MEKTVGTNVLGRFTPDTVPRVGSRETLAGSEPLDSE